MTQDEGTTPPRAPAEQRAAHRTATREVLLTVLWERAGEWYTASEIHALVRPRDQVGLEVVRQMLIALEREGHVEARSLNTTLDSKPRRQWRLRQSD